MFAFGISMLGLLLNTVAAPVATVSRQAQSTVTVTSADGGHIGCDTIDKASSLKVKWITIHDSSLAADLDGTTGIKVGSVEHTYVYQADFKVNAKQGITAVYVRFVLFDVWNRYMKTLADEEITDVDASQQGEFKASFEAGANDAADYSACIAYVYQVRSRDGKVAQSAARPIVAEARKIDPAFTEQLLDAGHSG